MVAPGSRNRDLVQNLDYASTFLEMAGVDLPGDLQGRSLVPLLKGERPADWRDAIYYHYYEYPSVHMVARHRGVRTDRFKLIHFYQFDEWEFYDLDADPLELRSQYDNPVYAETVASLKQRLEELRETYADDSDISPMPQEWREKVRTGGLRPKP
jgi:arylsulfatase A-like enzyme